MAYQFGLKLASDNKFCFCFFARFIFFIFLFLFLFFDGKSQYDMKYYWYLIRAVNTTENCYHVINVKNISESVSVWKYLSTHAGVRGLLRHRYKHSICHLLMTRQTASVGVCSHNFRPECMINKIYLGFSKPRINQLVALGMYNNMQSIDLIAFILRFAKCYSSLDNIRKIFIQETFACRRLILKTLKLLQLHFYNQIQYFIDTRKSKWSS